MTQRAFDEREPVRLRLSATTLALIATLAEPDETPEQTIVRVFTQQALREVED